MFGQPDSRPIPTGYRLQVPYRYEWTFAPPRPGRPVDYALEVPAGFEYDGASVPRFVWTLTGILPDGLLRAAALVHDWIYAHCGRLPEASFYRRGADGDWHYVTGIRWSRKDADRMFGRLMREAGMSSRKRKAAYLAVRCFGWWPWYRRLIRNYYAESGSFLG